MLSTVTNVSSLQAQNYLLQTENSLNLTTQQVTSGLRIVNSGVDAAGLAVANSDISNDAVLTQGVQNASDAQSELQIADGGLSNISQLLDRARTLATESASGSFTGDRSVLNSEFQSVIQEVNRQAQSIGLNTGGSLAQNIGVFVGGGQSSGDVTAAENGTVNINLAGATVDAQSLGLQGVQATNASSSDLSSASATSVQNIVDDTANQQPNNETTFYFSGPGFAGGNKVAVTVNLAGVTDTSTLTTAINNAIQSAGNGSTAAATAFANAGITASVVNTASGGQAIAFSSSNTAFQVQAGDVMANALMGNTVSSSNPNGAAIASTVTGGAATAATGTLGTATTLQFSGGGLSSPVSISLAAGSSLSAIQSQINDNTALQSAGISLTTATAGQALQFTDAQGQQFSVQAAGDTANFLGLGSFQAGNSGAVQYSTITAGTAYDSATAAGTANLEFSLNGSAGTTPISVNLSGGTGTSGNVEGNVDLSGAVTIAQDENLSVTVDGGAAQTITLHTADTTGAEVVNDINSQLTGATASLVTSGNASYLEITSDSTGANSSVAVANGTHTALADVFGTPTATAGTAGTLSLGTVVNDINQSIAGNSTLEAAGLSATDNGGKLEISSDNGTQFQLNAYGAGNLGFGTTGVQYGAGNTQSEAGFTEEDAGGAYQTGDIAFSGLNNGDDKQSVTISAVDATGATQSLTVQLQNNTTSQNGANIDSAINAINTALQQSNVSVLQGITAVADNVGGQQQINFISTQGFNVAIGSTASGAGLQDQGATQTANVVGTQVTANISTEQSATNAVNQLANSVQTLGNAQAAVGRGENLMTYATNLANSQLTNTEAAESGIMDVDMASASANLTQQQIQLQAGIAALAQANSNPQQILSLLQH